MKVNCEMVNIIWCDAKAMVPSQPTMMTLRLNEAVSILRDKPQNGDMLYNIIYLTYIAPERLTVVEICSKLHISDRQYYRLRQQAVNIISIRLWSAPAAELDSWLEVMSLLEVL